MTAGSTNQGRGMCSCWKVRRMKLILFERRS